MFTESYITCWTVHTNLHVTVVYNSQLTESNCSNPDSLFRCSEQTQHSTTEVLLSAYRPSIVRTTGSSQTM